MWPQLASSLFVYRKPKLAMAAVITLVFVILVSLAPMDYVDKFGFGIASGFGVYFIMTAGKALKSANGNLGVLMLASGFAMVALAVFFTDKATLAASALEDLVPLIIGAVGSVFTAVDDPNE